MATMTYSELLQMAESIGFPCAYDHFAEGEAPDPPYVVFLIPGDNSLIADGELYAEVANVAVELYTDFKDPSAEYAVQDVLRANGITWRKGEAWISAERLFEVAYSFGILLERDPPDATDPTNPTTPTGDTTLADSDATTSTATATTTSTDTTSSGSAESEEDTNGS